MFFCWGCNMLISGVKVTLIICLTILVSAILIISYSEYVNRYAIVTTQNNNVYIFDKKSTVLNRCNDNGCSLVETKLPSTVLGVTEAIGVSKMFGNGERQPMTSDASSPLVKKEAVKELESKPEHKEFEDEKKAVEAAKNKEGQKKEETKGDEAKKDDSKKEDESKKDEPKKDDSKKDDVKTEEPKKDEAKPAEPKKEEPKSDDSEFIE